MERITTANSSSLQHFFPKLVSAFAQFPDGLSGIRHIMSNGGGVTADATGIHNAGVVTVTNTSKILAQKTAAVVIASPTSWIQDSASTASSLFGMMITFIGKLRSLGGIFSYLTSRWALASFIAAIILNRVQFYASSREHLRPRWYVRLAIYLIPMLVFISQLQIMLQTLRCQTSPDFAQLRYGDPAKVTALDFGGESGFLYSLSSTLLWWQDDATCCGARNMSIPMLDENGDSLKGSMSVLFWFYISLCTSQLFETLSCSLQGRQPMPETGMTIFEHSLAFAECEAMISSILAAGKLAISAKDGGAVAEQFSMFLTKNEAIQKLNIPPEVLLVCLISCFSHLSSSILATVGIRDRVRLLSTGVWACSYLAAFVWSFVRIFSHPIQSANDLSILRFPTVCIIGFIPHVLIMVGISMCAVIYGIALLLTAVSVPEHLANGMSFGGRFRWAFGNLQANSQFLQNSTIRIKLSDDFYTTILKIGFSVLTAASEAVYLNEGTRVNIAQNTWLERQRIEELANNIDQRRSVTVPAELMSDEIARGVEFVDHLAGRPGTSPYATERRSKTRSGGIDRAHAMELDSGLGVTQRRSRMHLTIDFIGGLSWLIVKINASVVIRVLDKVGISRRPRWLLRAAGSADGRKAANQVEAASSSQSETLNVLDSSGRLVRASNQVNMETELRRRDHAYNGQPDEDESGDGLYRWWTKGGWFGETDASSDYQPGENADDDTTSMVSFATSANSVQDWSDGQRTPTQSSPFRGMSRESTPDVGNDLDLDNLSRLLNPQSRAERDEAQLLSYSLQSSGTMTRNAFRRRIDKDRSQLLRPFNATLPPEEEERDLEQYILQQRAKLSGRQPGSTTWHAGAEGMGEGGPQCVVCQSTPRTVLVWPCGCLSMCDDCRTGLAARNYTKCICCRTEVAAYSRLYVP